MEEPILRKFLISLRGTMKGESILKKISKRLR
jgi:hypothetical protein